MKMSETRAITTHRVFAGQMNEHESLFGGQTTAWLDESASIAAHRFARSPLVTGSIDRMVFTNPVQIGHALRYDSFVTGSGSRSIEVFTRMIGEDLDTGARYLAAWSLMTFVAPKGIHLPELEADLPLGQQLHAGYAARAAVNKQQRAGIPEIPLD